MLILSPPLCPVHPQPLGTASLQEVDCVTVNLALAGSRHYTKRGRVADVWYYLLLVQHYIIGGIFTLCSRPIARRNLYSCTAIRGSGNTGPRNGSRRHVTAQGRGGLCLFCTTYEWFNQGKTLHSATKKMMSFMDSPKSVRETAGCRMVGIHLIIIT